MPGGHGGRLTRSQAFGLFLLLALWLFAWDSNVYFLGYPLPTLSFHFTLWLALGGYVLAGIFGVLFLSKRLKVVRA